MSDWNTKQRGDLAPCPFCGTAAIEQELKSKPVRRIQCGNPFCEVECRTHPFASLADAERAWQARGNVGQGMIQG